MPSSGVLYLQMYFRIREQDLLFSNFSEDCSDIENGAEFNKVLRVHVVFAFAIPGLESPSDAAALFSQAVS